MVKVDGKEVYWPEYLYWLAADISYIYKMVGYYPTDWSAVITDNMTIKDYVMNSATNAVTMYRAVEKKASELGLSLSDADKAEIDSEVQSAITYQGGQEEFDKFLKNSCLNEDLYRYMLGVSILHEKVFTSMYGENAVKYSDADALAFAQNGGYMKVKHIYMPSSDDADKDKAVKDKMQGLLDQLKAAGGGAALTTLFDQLMKANSQDTGLTAYPDGYLFKPGEMDTQFESAAQALSVGGMSEIVKSSFGYHIILRLPIGANDTVFSASSQTPYSLRYYAAYDNFQKIVDGWIKDTSVEISDSVKNLDLGKIYK
jgi:Parvulin-like peptidyl-prolyl isomerase